ncbi:competence protein CoiA family protein [Idiomarina aminovorans]|uniref:competence protein CoiA family protein n=1 Tax=Idiomarina aminovorans TaxID=2914829 RepID=UPI00200317BF|nr:hypothetical protein [Idiomarina sp. ATCH4]MCK7458804.1 hypothetical protein [Idiomarina sp. ATCH4]
MSIIVALEADKRKVTSIEDVSSGLACNCICPACHTVLVARKGPEKRHHFAHYKADEDIHCRETALHLAAKQFFLNNDCTYLPGVECESSTLKTILNEPRTFEYAFFSHMRSIQTVEEEVWLNEHVYRPDIRCEVDVAGVWEPLLIEIAVTHKVDDDKAIKIKASGYSAIEIDLASLLKQPKVSVDELKQALCHPERIKWLNKSSRLLSHLQSIVQSENTALVAERNETIREWHLQISSQLLSSEKIHLPRYQFPTHILAKTIKLKDGKDYPVDKPGAPTIGGAFELQGISEITDSRFDLILSYKGATYKLPIALQVGGSPVGDLGKSYLTLNEVSLPDPRVFVARLRWGRSDRAEKYIKKVLSAQEAMRATKGAQIKRDITNKLKQFGQLRMNPHMAKCPNLAAIEKHYEQFIEELGWLNIDALRYTCDINDGWIFGCPQRYWQVISLRSICYLNSNGIGVPFLSKQLKRNFGIDVIEPVRSLQFMDTGKAVPNGWGILNSYLQFLDSCNILKRGYKEFEKTIIHGSNYQDKVFELKHEKRRHSARW